MVLVSGKTFTFTSGNIFGVEHICMKISFRILVLTGNNMGAEHRLVLLIVYHFYYIGFVQSVLTITIAVLEPLTKAR